MNARLNSTLAAAVLCVAMLSVPASARADDIDIFLGTSAGAADAPTVMFLLDNTSNWSRQSQKWQVTLPNGSTMTATQGEAEVAALENVLITLQSSTEPINVGIAMLTTNSGGAGTGGGYIRFGARDVTNAANNLALRNVLEQIRLGINAPIEKINMASKDETAAFYELWKYYAGFAPYSGAPNANNPLVDYQGATGGGPGPTSSAGLTPYAQGLTSGFAYDDGRYQSPILAHPCGAGFIIYIANNAQGQTGSTENVYQPSIIPPLAESVPAGPTTNPWTDEWTQYLYTTGVPVPDGQTNGSIVTYVLDSYQAQPNAAYSASLKSDAKKGGGRYYQVGTQAAIQVALLNILSDIQAVSSTFSSASIPVNATNRTQDLNEVFIPTFRPDGQDQPRWVGNLKQYQLINNNGNIDLGDANGAEALSTLSGFFDDCAQSFWTTDSTDRVQYPAGYWNFAPESVAAKGHCLNSAGSIYNDLPDGPVVEKGGVSEVVRKGNNPPATNATPTWSPSGRNVMTLSGLSSTSLVPFSTATTGLPASVVSWVRGYDVMDENGNGVLTESRPSLHGDTIHSRPLPVNYGTGSVVVYYGSNDGTLRAVDASSGQELWAFVAPEFYNPAPAVYTQTNGVGNGVTPTGFERLMWSGLTDGSGAQISPIVKFPGLPSGLTPTPMPKDYYFDGSIGVYQSAGSASVWIYPTMRRGGRMLYALDVSTPTSPSVLWKAGCPSLTTDTGCTSNMSGMGQTWSMPAVAASIQGYSGPVIIVGGGYDTCEDANTSSPSCGSEKGRAVYVLDAQTGTLIKSFSTLRSVAGDVALIAVATAGVVDHAYAADTGGNIYRIDFGSSVGNWVMNRVAYTNGAGRKFLYAPALLAAPGQQVYLALGSGDREHPLGAQYPYSGVLNRFYVYRDSLASTSATNLDDPSVMSDNTATNSCSAPSILPTSAMKGWSMNLNQAGQGEQTVTSAIIVAGLVAFSTNRPVPPFAGTCGTVLGQANGYFVNLFNASGAIAANGSACGGNRSAPFVGGGLPPSPVLATVPVDGQLMQVVIGAANLAGDPSSPISPQQVKPTIIPHRKTVYWRSSGEN